MAYKYQQIWHTIKVEQKAVITVHKSVVATVVQGVKRTKCAENAHRSSVGLIPWSKLQITKELLSDRTGMMRITFALLYDTRV